MTPRSVRVLVLLVAIAHHAQAQPAADPLEAMMIADGQGERGPFALVEERLQVAIDGQHAQSTLLQVYQNTTAQRLEGHYRLRPGIGSHVDGFAYWNGEDKIVGEVFEKETARRVYDRVTSRMRDPGLLEQDGEGTFAFKVFPIQPSEKKRVELRWSRWLERRGHTVTYRAPVGRDDASIVIEISGPTKGLRSPTHRLHAEALPGGGTRLRADGTGKGQLVLEWEDGEADWTPSVYVQPGSGNDEGWFALALAAPDVPAKDIAAKDVTIVIDRSGSMEGEKMAHAIAAAAGMVRLLHDDDRVNVISFSDEVDPLFKTPQPIDADTRARATTFIRELRAGGGTDIALALSTALKAQAPKEARPRVVVFVTDGQSDADKALAAARADAGDIRVFTLGLGQDVNRPLLQRLAADKRGTFTYIENASSIEPEVGRLAAHIAKPLLVGVSLDVDGANAVRIYPRSLPDLFAEDELLITGRLRGTGTAKFTVKGLLGGKPMAFSKTVDLAKATPRPWLGALWAQSRVEHLLEELSLGGSAPEIVDEVVGLAVAYNFVTPYTSFLAVPESELGDMRGTIAAAREKKRKILEDHRDAVVARGDARRGGDDDEDDSAPAKKSKGRVASFGADDNDAEASSPAPTSMGGHGEEVITVQRGRGCAGCTSLRADPASVLVVCLVVVMLRRKRRS